MKNLNYGNFIKSSGQCFAERGFEAVLAVNLVGLVLFLLQFFPIVGVTLAIFAFGFLCVGVKKYLIAVSKNKYVPIESIFDEYKICIKAFCLKFATMLISFLWGIIFVIPGIICAINYSMSMFVLAENSQKDAFECMLESKNITKGHRLQILIIYLAYCFVIVACVCIFASIGIAVFSFAGLLNWVAIVLTAVAVLMVLFVFIIPYFELLLANLYLYLKNEHAQSKKVINSRKISPKTQNE